MSKLLEYLNTLDKDATAREAHVNDPLGAMTDFGLTEEEKTAVHSGDTQAVADVLGISVDKLNALDTIVTLY
ncbi:hypothetical protein ACO0LL_12630 [Undibacterium sp. TC4M20W]|jgi:hypothetical protein|uniref:hypothetical protein n=1 Tax=unclassified Undibacterium TaxID=2630295 RepID=UPI001331DCDD|nr:hypothetical protein [Undibacterium sp. YM2]BBB66016.1 hypothetical protein UNDYM_1763 [Undibacterium sp. YM2]